MGDPKGFTSIAGWKKSTTWGTPVAVGASEGIRYNTMEPGASVQLLESEELSGERSRLAGDRGNILHAPTLTCEGVYEGLERLIAQAMGTAGAPSQVGSDNAYKHVFKPKNELDGIHGTLVFYLKSKPCVLEYTTAKVNGLGFSVGAGNQRAQFTFPMIAHKRNRNEGSGTNTNTTAAAITFPANRDFVNFANMAVRMNQTTAAGLASPADLIYPSEFSLTISNQLPTDDVTTRYVPYIDEPIGGNFFDVQLSMTFSKAFQNLAILDEMLATGATRFKADVIFTGPAIGATNFKLSLYLPALQFQGDPPGIGGPDRLTETWNMKGSRVTAAPTGFPAGYTDALTIELINQRNSDALA
jgi:hypothetical protein